MRINRWGLLLSVMFLTFAALPNNLSAQQQYGQLQIQVVDQTQAVMPGASVELTSPALIRPITGTADGRGMFIATALPPGLYTITVRAVGFRAAVLENVPVAVGRTYSVELVCEVGAVEETVTVESGTDLIDVIKSESALVFKGDLITNSAGGRDFSSYASLMPSVNIESGYAITGGGAHRGRANVQILVDGSSGAENVFYVDGIDTTSMYNGLNNQNLRTEMVEEFQLKTAGYEAEFGGAMGGVMSVRTRSGSNDFHGSLLWYYSGSTLTAEPRQRLRLDPASAVDVAEYVQDQEDSSNRNEVGLTLGGPIVPDKAWFFGAFLPQWRATTREVTFTSGESGIFRQSTQLKNATVKFDVQPWEPVKMFASYIVDWYRWKGGLPSLDGTSNPAFDWARQGFEFPGSTVSGGATITASPNFIIDARWGLNAISTDQFLGPDQVRHRFDRSPGLIGFATTDPLYRPRGFWTIGHADSFNTTQDFQKKSTLKFDGSWLASAGGQHNLRFGWQFNRLTHNVNEAYKFDYIRYNYSRPYTLIDGTILTSTCTGPDGIVYDPCGYYDQRSPYGVVADIHTDRQALYFQDGWTIGGRLTLNLGVRFEKEEIPSFSDIPEFAGAAFSWGFTDKVAPRLGFAYDLLGNQKVKIHASWGWFFDAMKLEMANGSFGGFKWLSNYYLMDDTTLDWTQIGGLSGQGNYPGTYMETRNWRIPSFDDLDPDIKPMRMSEFVGGFEWETAPNYIFSFRFTHKQLDEAIEDVGRQTPAGEAYYITNPGRGFSVSKFLEAGLPPTPDPERTYNAWEFRLRKAFSDRWHGDLSYTYSRLRGLYSGLGSSDENGRLSPNVDRDFDLWFLNYDSNGNLLSGPLQTDRPHQIKFNGSYTTPWNTELGGFFRAMSGTPISRWTSFENVEIHVDNRGSDGRNPFWIQTDFMVIQRFHPFDDEAKTLEFNFNVINLFNQKTALRTFRTIYRDNMPLWQPGDDPNIVLNGYDVDAIAACIGLDASGNCIANVPDPRFLQRDRFLPPIAARFGVRFVW
ncbi:MAG: TonB-dependent receptor [Phycisphaerae bacterium]